MIVDLLGRALSGVGASGVWLDNRNLVPPGAGKPASLDFDTIVYQTSTGQLAAYQISTRLSTILGPMGATTVVASGHGQWAAYLADGHSGVRTSWGAHFADHALLGMAPDGTVFTMKAYTGIYATGGYTPGVVVSDALPIALNDVPQFSCLSATQFLWREASGLLRSYGLPTPRQTDPVVYDPFVAEVNGRYFVGYHTDRFVLHPIDDASQGWTIATGETFGTHGRGIGSRVVCGYATGEAENGNTVLVAHDPTTQMTSLRPSLRFTHPVLVAPFFPTPQAPGGACIAANGKKWSEVAPAGALLIVTLDALAAEVPPPDRFLGILCAINEIPAAMASALAHGVRLFVLYDEHDAYPTTALQRLRPCDVPVLEGYLGYTGTLETLDQSVARWTANIEDLSRKWDYAIGFVSQNYLGLVSLQNVLDAQAPTVALVNRYSSILLVAPFALDRKDGGQIPDIAASITDLAHATPGMPAFVPVSPVTPPVVSPPIVTPPIVTPPIIPGDPMPAFMNTSSAGTFNAIVTEAPHQDAGWMALRDPDGQVASVDDNDGTFSWKPKDTNPGAWERFKNCGNCYVAVRTAGTYAFVKSGSF